LTCRWFRSLVMNLANTSPFCSRSRFLVKVGFVDALARRIASFDRRAIAAAKNLVNQVSLPSADRLLDGIPPLGPC
jgi:hypothetical protein